MASSAPVMVDLPVMEGVVVMRGNEEGQENVLGDLGAMNARGSGQGDVGIGVDWVGLDVVGAGGGEMNER